MTVDAAFALFARAFRAGRTAHAYIFAGPPRGAAGELAVRAIQLLACKRPDPPCGACDDCRQVRERIWADALWVQPESKSRIISVNAMRQTVIPFACQTSFLGGWKAIVFVGAECINEAAANAFLLTLEEPPANTVFLLLTDAPQVLLPTIASRCQRISVAESADPGAQLAPEARAEAIDAIASAVNGGPTSAMATAARLSALLATFREQAEKEVMAAVKDESDLLDEDKKVIEARISARYRESRAGVLECLLSWYRDLLVLRSGGDPSIVANQDRLPLLQERAARLTLSQALANVDGIEELARQLDRSIPEPTLLAYWIDRLYSGAR